MGRDEELARIERALSDAAGGRPRILFVSGEAGIGKSRLVREAIDRARARGSPILHGACLDIGQGWLPYLPVVEALRGLARDLPPERLSHVLGPGRADFARLLPSLATDEEAPPPTADGEGPSIGERARLFERFIGLLGRLSEDAATLAVVEDVQWIDPATRDLLTFLVRNMTIEPVAAVLTVRTDELATGHPVLAWLAELGRAPGALQVELGRLDRSSVTRQLEAIAGTTIDERVAQRVWRRSEGNPLFAEELLAAELDVSPQSRPPSLVDVVLARIGRLSAEAKDVLEALAVAGRPADEQLLAPALGQDDWAVGGHLREAVSQGIVLLTPDGRYHFRHELLREVVEREVPAGQRRSLHERFARELEKRPELAESGPAGPQGELARHWAQADRPVEAYHATLAAAAAAEDVNAVEQAHTLLQAAIDLESRLPADDQPTREVQIDTRRRAADAADLARQFDDAIRLTLDALGLVDVDTDSATAGLLHARLGYLRWVTGDAATSLNEHREAVRLVPDTPPSKARARVLGGLAGGLMGLGRWEESRSIATEAIECAHTVGAIAEESRSRNFLGSDLVALGEVEAGLAELRGSHELARETGTSDLIIVTGYNLALNLMVADRPEDAREMASRMWQEARDHGLERRFGMDLAALAADALLRTGRWDDAERTTEEGLALDQRRRGRPYLAAVRSRLAALRGAAGEAERRLSDLEDLSDEPDMLAYATSVRAEANLVRDDPAIAATIVLEALPMTSVAGNGWWTAPVLGLGLRALADVAETARAEHDETALADVTKRSEALEADLTRLPEGDHSASVAAWIVTGRAEVARLRGVSDRAVWRDATQMWTALGDVYAAAYTSFREAEAALRAEGVRADVSGLLRVAYQSTSELRAEPLGRVVGQLAARARIELVPAAEPAAEAPAPHPVASRPAHRLSAREIEVLRLVAAGRTNGEIADELFITRKTAGVHVTHILDKLGVSNRVEAAMAAARLGIVSSGEG